MSLKEEIDELTKPAVYDRVHFSTLYDPNAFGKPLRTDVYDSRTGKWTRIQ